MRSRRRVCGQTGARDRALPLACALALGAAFLACVAAPVKGPPEAGPRPGPRPRVDLYGDPLPEGAVARCGTVRLRHGSVVYSVAFSPDGKTLASASFDKTVRLWDVTTGRQYRKLVATDEVASVAFSPDGRLLAAGTGREDKAIIFWDVANGTKRFELKGHRDYVDSLAFSPDGKLLASSGWDEQVRVWDVPTRRLLHSLQVGHYVHGVAFSPEGKTVAYGCGDGFVRFLDAATGKEIRTVKGEGRANAIAISPDGRIVASGGSGEGVTLWEAETGKPLHKVAGSAIVHSLAFSPDGKTVAVGHETDCYNKVTASMWDVSSGQMICEIKNRGSTCRSVAFSPDGELLALAQDLGKVQVVEAATGKQRFDDTGHWGEIHRLRFLSGGNRIVSAAEDGTVHIWDLPTGNRLHAFTGELFALSSDGRLLATSAWPNRKVNIWDTASGEKLRVVGQEQSTVMCMSFSPAESTLATGTYNGGTVLWDTATGERIAWMGGHTGQLWHLAFSPDGAKLASGSRDRKVCIWNMATRKPLQVIAVSYRYGVRRLAFSSDSRFLAYGGSASFHLWDVDARREAFAREGDVLAFSPDARMIAARSGDSVHLWDVALGEKTHTFAEAGAHDAVAFSPDSRLLAAARRGGTVLLWDTATGRRLLELTGHEGEIGALAFSGDGRYLVSGSADTTVLIWDMERLVNQR